MLSLNDNNAWYYPSHGHDSDDEQFTKYSENGNWGKKHMKGARWVRRGKMAAWGPGLDDWEAEEHARKRVRDLLPPRQRSRSPPTLAHLRSPSPPMTAPYPTPKMPHLSYSSFVMDKAVIRSFRSGLLDELEEVTNGLVEGEATLRRALGRLWQVIAEEADNGQKEGAGLVVVPKVEEEEDGEGEDGDTRARRHARTPDLTPAIRKVFLGSYSNDGMHEVSAPFASGGDVQDGLEKSVGSLRELEDDGREYVERLEEIREGLGEVRDERNGVWEMVRREGMEEMQSEVRYKWNGITDRRGV